MSRIFTTKDLAHEARIASLEAQLAKALDRIANLEKRKAKPPVLDLTERQARVIMGTIAAQVAQEFGVTVERMRSHDRRHVFAAPRAKAWRLCHEAGYSTPMIGRFFGGRDHSTILAGMKAYPKQGGEA